MIGYLRNLLEALDFTSMGAAAMRVAAVFLCLTVHETCHGLAAFALGDPTARNLHRLSLNPLRHVDWLGLAMMFIAGFGWAKPVPVDPRYFRNPKWGMAFTALAGPASNFLLALASLFLARIPATLAPNGRSVVFFAYSVPLLSLGLGVFNLIPFPPLDGSKVLAAFLPDRLYISWMRYERFGMLVLFAVLMLGWDGNFVSRAVYWLYLHMAQLVF
ncbi:MAG: site-2 protease family protein [Oscillibacter sp.]|nr:site-2 protease family protein [Oscillibacter sp.]